jgi:hypothetical protein
MNGKQRKYLIPGAVLGVCLAGYAGLSLHASRQVEKDLEDFVYSARLDDKVRWQSVSATPFSDAITLTGVELGSEDQPGLRLNIETLRIAELSGEKGEESISLQLQGASLVSEGRRPLPFARELQQSGRNSLEPFDLSLAARYEGDDDELAIAYRMRVPEQLEVEADLTLGALSRLELFNQLMDGALRDAELGSLEDIGAMLMFGSIAGIASVSSLEVGESRVSVRDLGYFQRRSKLEQRYNYALSPGRGSAEEQREQALVKAMRAKEAECSKAFTPLYADAESACRDWVALIHGQGDGMRLEISPERRVRLGDLVGVDSPARLRRTVENLNARVEGL